MPTTKKHVTSATTNSLLVEFYINDKLVREIAAPETTALKMIRDQLHLVGTKEPCNEGDCGGCTIALGAWENNKFQYQAINSCILPAARLHGCHIITVEGLVQGKQLHLIQQAMLKHHAVQCGFCTSGFVMAIFCLLLNKPLPDNSEITEALAGNLCRCTGYKFINEAIMAIIHKLQQDKKLISSLLPAYAKKIQNNLKITKPIEQVSTKPDELDICKNYYAPLDLKRLFSLMEQAKGRFNIINGGTDLMVQGNIHDIWPENLLDISQISQLNFINEYKDKIVIGGNVTFGQLQASDLIKTKLPTFFAAMLQMASKQIRNVATPAGNIINASPIADGVCVLLALGTTLVIQSKNDKYKIKLEEFYRDYKITKIDKNKEIIFAIEVPLENSYCSFEKTAKRSALDIATVNSCLNLEMKADKVKSCRLAFGGVAKVPALAKQASDFLIGKEINKENIIMVAQQAVKDFMPISDVRGSAEYRRLLIQNHIIKHFDKIMGF